MKKRTFPPFPMIVVFMIGLLNCSLLNAQKDILDKCETSVYNCDPGSIEINYNFDTGGTDSTVILENTSGFRALDAGASNKQYSFFCTNNNDPCYNSTNTLDGEFLIRFRYDGSPASVSEVYFTIYGASSKINVTVFPAAAGTTVSTDIQSSYIKYTCEAIITPIEYITITCEFDPVAIPPAEAYILDELHVPTEPAVNPAPTDISTVPASPSIDENVANTLVCNLLTTDDAGDTHTYALVTGDGDTDNSSFQISGSELYTSATPPDFEVTAVCHVRIETTDSHGGKYQESIEITVNNIEENNIPENILLSNSSISENNICGAQVGMLSTTDDDAGDTFTYTLVSGTGDTDNSLFTISGNILYAGAIFNYETKNQYSVRIRTTDGAGGYIEKEFQISVADILNEGTPEVVCLFDLSGSMNTDFNYNTPSDPEKVKLAQTKDAFRGFSNLLYDLYADNVLMGIARYPGDPYSGCTGQILSPLGLFNTAYKGTLESVVNSFSASWNTPLLAGIDAARTMYGTGGRKVLLLLTDGIHNCPSPAVANSTITAYTDNLKAAGVSVYSIGFGLPDFIPNHLLDALASGTCGINYDITAPKANYHPDLPDPWDPETALSSTFASILVNGLGANMVIDPLDIIPRGAKQQFIVPVTDLDDKVCFYVSWVKKQENYLGIRLITPGGTDLPLALPGIKNTSGSEYRIITLTQDLLIQPGMTGNWQIEVDGSGISDSTERYQLTVISTSQRITLNTWVDKEKFYTGKEINIYLELLYQGSRVTGIDKITAGGTGPGISPGNWLTGKPVTPAQIENAKNKITEQQMPWILQSPVLRKLDKISAQKYIDLQKIKIVDGIDPVTIRSWIMRNDYKLVYPQRISISDLQFSDEGLNGDQNAGDGIYTAVYTPGKEGTYRFNVTAVESRDGRNLQRENHVEVYVHTRIRLEKFIKEIHLTPEIISGEKVYEVILDLSDANGNIPIPSALEGIKFSLDKGKAIGGIIDNLDGTFTQKVSLAANIKPRNVMMRLKSGVDYGEQKLEKSSKLLYGIGAALLVIIGVFFRGSRR